MTAMNKRWFAALTIVGFAAGFLAVGVSLSRAQDSKAPDLSNLRDAVKAASKRGNNVDEIVKAIDALDKYLAKGFAAPKAGDSPAVPAELLELRQAVEMAGRKGEDVDAIRTELDAIEKAIVGKALTPPRPAPLPEPPAPPAPPRGQPFPGVPFDRPFPIPDFPVPEFRGGGGDRELMEKANQLRKKAFEMLRNNPTDAEAMQLMKEAQELLLKAMLGGRGGLVMPDLAVPPLPERVAERFRLGIRMERLAPITAEQLGLEGKGVAVTAVVPGSPADKAGIKANDIVIEFAGKEVSDNPDDLSRQVGEAKVGAKVDIVVLRRGKKVELKGIELPKEQRVEPRFDGRPFPVPNPLLPDLLPLPGGFPDAKPLPLFPNPFADGAGNSVSVSNVNGQVTIKARQDGIDYLITGTQGDDGLAVDKVSIKDGDKPPVEVKSLKDVPKDYQPMVEKLIGNARPPKPRVRD